MKARQPFYIKNQELVFAWSASAQEIRCDLKVTQNGIIFMIILSFFLIRFILIQEVSVN